MKFYPDFFVSRKNSTKFEFDPSVLYGNTTLAESVLVFSLIILLVVDSANERERNWFYLIPTTGLLTSMVILLLNWGEESTKILLGSLQIDSFVRIFQFLIALCSLLCIPLSMRYLECVEMPMTEFMTFLLTATIGGMFLCGANDLVTIFVCLECLSLCSYLLCGYAKRDVRSNEAAMKFLLVGGTSSSILAYGFSWIYGLSGGEIQLQKIVDGLSSTQMFNSAGSSLAIVCIVVGIAFKLSLVPFHQWTPDVYEGSPTPVVAFLSVVSKIAGLALITRIFYVVFTPSPDEWKPMLEVLAISSMVLGNSVALTQKSMKRMLAYSSISQMGYLSIGLITGGFAGCSSMIIYIFFYIFMNIGTFACIISFSSRTGTDNIRDYSGLYIKDPLLTFSSSSCLSSLGGIPPLTGFFGKLYPFRCGWRAGFHPLVLAGLATSIISIYYYLQIVKLLITGRDGGFNYYARTHAIISNKSTAKSYLEPSMIFCALTSIFLGLFINPIIDLVRYNLDRLIFLIG